MIFKKVRYFLPSSFTSQRREELSLVLNANGGEESTLEEASHVITNSHVFEGYQSVSDNVVVVSDFWVDRSVVLGKQQNPKIYSADPIMIFSGVTACTSEIVASDQEVIAAGLNGLGGLFREGFTRDCTHLIVPRPGSDKYDAAIQHKKTMQLRVVVPQWFDDCFQQMMHLPEAPYEWPEPEILRCSNVGGDPAKKKCVIPKPRRDLIRTALSTLPEDDEELKIDKALATVAPNVWERRKILLSPNLALEQAMQSVKTSIKRGGGKLLELDMSQDEDAQEEEELAKVAEADIYISQYRSGRAYLKALELRKTVGSLAWLLHVQKTGTIVRPEDHLLHYPRRSKGIPGFERHVMTISNYSDDARSYLKRLITLMGGRFTADMNQQNTVIVAAFLQGKKTEKAREWDITIVNHTWLEDCFVAWRNITPAQEKYIVFPAGLSFAEIVAQRGVGRIGFDVGSPQEIAAIEAEIEKAEQGKKERRREKAKALAREREAVEETRVDEGQEIRSTKSPRKGTQASQDAREVEDLMDLDEAPPAYFDDDGVQEIIPEPEPERSPTPSLPVAPAKTRGKPSKAASKVKKAITTEDEEEGESQPRQGSRSNANERKGAAGSSKARSARAAQTESELEEEEDEPPPSESPEETAKRGRPMKAASKARARPPSIAVSEEPEELAEKPTAKQSKYKAVQPPAKGKGKEKAKGASSKASSRQEVIEIDSNTESDPEPELVPEPEPEPYPTRRQTRSLTRSPAKSAQAPTATTSFYAPSPKKSTTTAAAKGSASDASKQKKPSMSSRITEMMQDIPSSESEDDLDAVGLSPLKPTKAKAKEKARLPSSSPLSSPGKATSVHELSDDEERAGTSDDDDRARKRSKAAHSPAVVTRVAPPKGRAKAKTTLAAIAANKKGPIATSTPKRALPRRRADSEEEEIPIYPAPTPNRIVEVEIESQQESPPVAGPSRLATAKASELPATPSRGRPSKKRARSPSQSRSPSPSPVTSKSKDKQTKKTTPARKSETPASVEPPELNSTTGRPPGRQAKVLAAQKLKEDVSDANKFQKEKKSGRIRGSWEDERKGSTSSNKGKGRATEPSAEAEASGSIKRRASGASSAAEEVDDEGISRGKKRKVNDATPAGTKKKARFEAADVESQESRLSDDGLSGRAIKYMTTGIKLEDKTREALAKLGMQEARKAAECTHLLVNAIMRTEKFLLALANGPFILTKDWALQCARLKRVLPPGDYTLHDPDGEKKHGINLETTLTKARYEKGKLFKNHKFFLTSKVTNYMTLKNAIIGHGGKVETSRPSIDKINKNKDSFHIISCFEDKNQWERLAEEGYPVFSPEAIYTAVLRQEMDWSDKANQIEL